MRDNRPYLINNLFSSTADMSRVSLLKIQQQAILLLNLNRAVNTLLPTVLYPFCRVASFRQRILVLETANASWKMRLQYEQPQLLSALKAQILPSLSFIDIRINPTLAIKQELNTQKNNDSRHIEQLLEEKPRRLSVQSAASIRHLAARSEGNLKNALERLAKLAGGTIKLESHER
ncbi:MAG: DUF721 domain-containing protein [Sodalis sp. (in: enterobacteria)]